MFDLRKIRLAVSDQHREQIPVTVRPLTVGGVPYRPTPAQATGDLAVTRLRSGFVFDLEFAVRLVGPCHRCLEEATVELEIESEEYDAFNKEPGAEADMTCEYLTDDVVDTDRWASDATVLAMPVQILCRPDCQGLCPVCGADLNAGPHEHEQPGSDERWAALRRLEL